VTASAVGAPRTGPASPGPAGTGSAAKPDDADRRLIIAGTIAATAVTASGLAVITLLVLAGWIAAPHAGAGLPAVLRTATMLWLVGQHVGFTLRGAGRIGLLPLGLVMLPGALLWRAGRYTVRAAQVRRLRQAGYAALALAVPYALITGILALASRSGLAAASVLQSVGCGLLLAVVAGGLGAARTLARWSQLVRLLPPRPRSVIVGLAGSLAVLAAAGALLAGIAVGVHLQRAVTLERNLAPGAVGLVLLLLLQIGYLPNAVVWAVSFTLGPGFAFGSATVVSPAGSALAQLPAFPLLAALPPGLHTAMPGWLGPAVLVLPYLAGGFGGVLLVRAAPGLALDAAPLWGLAVGGLAGAVLGLLAALSGGPLGDGRLAAVGPSAWQVATVAALEIGISAAIAAGVAAYLRLRRAGELTTSRPDTAAGPAGPSAGPGTDRDAAAAAGPQGPDAAGGHVIYLNPWAGDPADERLYKPSGPSSLP
jgi:hypothetical protein